MFLLLILFLLLPHVVFADCPSDSVLYPSLSLCYFFITTPQNFSDAEHTCNNLGGNLASIHDSFANNFIYSGAEFAFSTNTNFTIGALCNSSVNCLWTDGSSYTYNDFRMPSNIEGCGTMSTSNGGYWDIKNCFDKRPFVCQRAETLTTPTATPTQLCPSNEWYYFSETNSCYYWTNASNWSTTEGFCVNQGAHLASLHSSSEINFLNYIFNGAVWVGLHANDNPVEFNTAWKWTDQSYADYLSWSSDVGMPSLGENNQCVAAQIGVIWNGDCSTNRTGICKRPSSKIVTTTYSPPIPKCLDGWTYYPKTQFCYLGPTPVLSQNEAEQFCSSKGGHLSSVHSNNELKFLWYATSQNLSWIGLNASDNPVQINTTWKWSDNTAVDFLSWNNSIPSLDDKLCATSVYPIRYRNGKTYPFVNADCSLTYPAICKQPTLIPTSTRAPAFTTPSPCDNVLAFSNYFVPLIQLNITIAEEYCEFCGGYLTSIHNIHDLQGIVYKLYDNGDLTINSGYFWIGLKSDNNGRTWQWNDGTIFDFSYWMSGYPEQGGESCGNLFIPYSNNYGMTNSKNCSTSLYSICKYR